jgi:MFS family permease
VFESLRPPPGPARMLALSELVCRVGDGAYYVCAALYFTRLAGLSPMQMGLGLTTGWSIALLMSVPLGHVADRAGPRGTAAVLFVCAAAAVASYIFISSFVPFVVAASVYAVSQRGASAAQQALLAAVIAEPERVHVRALVQSSYNAGLAVGAGLGGLVLLSGGREAYYAAFALNAATLVAASVVLSRLAAVRPAAVSDPPGPSAEAAPAAAGSVFRDRRYVAFSALNTLLLLYIPLFDIALPLWIARHTAAPVWLLSLLFVLNTLAVVTFQVRVSRGVHDQQSARRYVLRGSLLLAAGCVVFAFSAAGGSAWVAGVLLLVAVIVQVAGEMMHAAGSWELSFSLAPPHKHGQYQAFFGNGFTVAEMAGPSVLTALIVYWGPAGWILLGAVLVAAAAAMQPVVRRAAMPSRAD